ncbi:uncharacterized protein PHACADRAFT_187554 [Phanerochaete carnosa HHB-10118-sp]|uniref:Uncharacterized protein n=1 Tax=Phanerochaete carnosa (strain HHB-10118-sp) TaxID=650164 RepID=K5WKX1_PHACS|nr:uncharacterized protein PHACADRAFT_187554 [Phanerochaete carnosa HHB-10118-sp]EKM50907.1 hypothetical protein PHACADRAFT_187554 [Phanerochaete carnosa HHB-10118-sp]
MAAIPPPGTWNICRSVRQVPGLSVKEQKALKTYLSTLCKKYLDLQKLWQDQDAKAKATLHREARTGFPLLSRYKDEWPVAFVLRSFLIGSRSKSKTPAHASRKPGKKVKSVPARPKRPMSSPSVRFDEIRESSADDHPESEDETTRASGYISSVRNGHGHEVSTTDPAAEMAVVHDPEDEGGHRFSSDTTQVLNHNGPTREQSTHADGSIDPMQPSESDLMYPAETKLSMEEVRVF